MCVCVCVYFFSSLACIVVCECDFGNTQTQRSTSTYSKLLFWEKYKSTSTLFTFPHNSFNIAWEIARRKVHRQVRRLAWNLSTRLMNKSRICKKSVRKLTFFRAEWQLLRLIAMMGKVTQELGKLALYNNAWIGPLRNLDEQPPRSWVFLCC